MRRVRFVIAAILLCIAPRGAAQIFADFTVSHGGVPVGTFRARLDFDKAPRTCANFIGLANGQRPWVDLKTGRIRAGVPFYDGLTFHRLIHDFMIQGGSRNGLGTDGPGFSIQDEYHPGLRHGGRYVLSMAKGSLPGSGGSQFFITLEDSSFLDDKHSVFGEVVEGREVVDLFANPALFPTDRSVAGAVPNDPAYVDRPVTPIVIETVVVAGPSLAGFDVAAASLRLPHVIGQPAMLPSRDAEAQTFAVRFGRAAQAEYLWFRSTDLQAWSPLTRTLSVSAMADYSFTVTGVSAPRYFLRVPAVDYGDVVNAPGNLTAAGRVLSLTDRAGGNVTLTFDGNGGGTWSDSSGGSGALTDVSWGDFIPAGGSSSSATGYAPQLPLGQLVVTFDSPAGAAGWTWLNVFLSFHEPLSGHVENHPFFGQVVRHAFALSP